MFWVDLSKASLIDGSFTTATPTSTVIPITNPNLYVPQAKLGNGNYIYVWSGGYGIDKGVGNGGSGGTTNSNITHDTYLDNIVVGNSVNYFGLSSVTGATVVGGNTDPGLTVGQSISIDKKIDDGYPQTGRVTAMYPNYLANFWILWAQGPPKQGNGGYISAPSDSTTATSGSSMTCYDNGGQAGKVQNYSVSQNTSNLNCALSIQFY